MKEFLSIKGWLAGLQWLFFLFTNTVVIPITVGAAFQLSHETLVSLVQCSFLFTGLACILQAFLGHKRSIMEGQSGLWWGVILSLCYGAAESGMSLATIGGSLSVGIIISGIITIVIGVSGLSGYLSRLFNNGVMAVFLFLLACRLNTMFLQGMLGIPFGKGDGEAHIDVPIFLLSVAVVAFVIIFSIKASPSFAKYSLLIGIIVGWVSFNILLGEKAAVEVSEGVSIKLFPLGSPSFDIGIILTAVIAGLINTSNTFGALKGTDEIYKKEATNGEYRGSFTISGVLGICSGLFGLVPFAPYVSSIGFLQQTKIVERLPFLIGGALFTLMGAVPYVGNMMAKLPLSIGSAVLLVTYLRLLHSSFNYFITITFTPENVYRLSIPLFIGIGLMTFPASYFETVPSILRPLASNGLLMGILLSLLLENIKLSKQNIKKEASIEEERRDKGE
jgi:xanthine/uracil permease